MTAAGRVAAAVAVITLVAAPTAAGQDTTRVRADSLPGAAPDSQIPLDPFAHGRTLPMFQPEVPPGPLPPGSRYTFTRDSLLWAGALTLADLLARIPGVYVARAGFIGQPEYVQYGGRGGAALEVFWDGMRWEPLGGDTAFVDPGDFPLTYFRRVDIEVLPGMLRAYLVTERHETPVVRSKIHVQSGAFKSAQYAALFQKRTATGIGLDLAANYAGTDGPSGAAGADLFDVWARVSWQPDGRVGASYQIRRQDVDRDGLPAGVGTSVPARDGVRTDMLITLSAATRPDGLGLRVETGLASSVWSADSGAALSDHGVRQAHLGVRYRRPSWTVDAVGRLADARTPLGLEGRMGWVPVRGIVLAADGGYRRHRGDRHSQWVRGAVGVYVGPVTLAGEATLREAVQAPALVDDSVVPTRDLAARAGLDTRWLSGTVTLARQDAFQPLPYADLPIVPSLGAAGETTYLRVEATLRPWKALTLSGWYSDPLSGAPAGLQPPQHVRAALTWRSKFWKTFRSGAFDLKAQVAIETWGAGTAGARADGSVIALPEATFWETQIEFQLVDFTAFWALRNARLTDAEYVPGLAYPGNAQYFGVSWTFGN
ncbi:MAG: Plug domain-containing protein [Gemmatimonadota bacterium]|nr:Plug domain-containing protein [Gemmatimonadota bacterium]